MDKKIIEDGFNLVDKSSLGLVQPKLRGKVVIKDDNGNVILEKDNMIVLRGRVFALETLFSDLNEDPEYLKNLNRTVCLFKMGNGGTPVSSPFQPYTPNHTDLDLASPLPFRIVDANDSRTQLTTAEQQVYYGDVVSTLNPDVREYYYKRFENVDPEWRIDKIGNEAYKKMVLHVNELDFKTTPTGNVDDPYTRNAIVNELGLFFAHYNTVSNKYEDIEMFSRICFNTEALKSATKAITIEYYIFA